MAFRPFASSRKGVLGWVPQVVKLGQNRYRTQIRLLALSALVGIVAGLGAIVFFVATRVVEHYALGCVVGYYPEPHPGGETPLPWLSVVSHPFYPWLLLVVPALGGLVSGVLVFTLAPEAEGHGTDSVIDAYHHRQGQIRPRVPLVKIVASSIYSSQVESRSLSPAHQGSYVRQVLAQVRVSQFLSTGQTVQTLHPGDTLATITERLSSAVHSVLPVTDSGNRLLGVVTLDEIYLTSQSTALHPLVVAEDLMRGDIQPLTPDDTLDRALELFVENDLLTLPVVTNLVEKQVLGMVSRFDISSSYLRHVHGPVQPSVR
jgi:CBS domain-containing protein